MRQGKIRYHLQVLKHINVFQRGRKDNISLNMNFIEEKPISFIFLSHEKYVNSKVNEWKTA